MIYHVTLSGGGKDHLEADSAADAICLALEVHRGQTVTECWVGNVYTGQIRYDVPRHDALPKKVSPGGAPREDLPPIPGLFG